MASHLLEKEKIEKILEKLYEVMKYAIENSDYYSNIYKKNIVKINSIEQMKQIPYAERSELQQYYPFKHLCVGLEEVDAYFETTGSTGNPFPVIPNLNQEKMKMFGKFLDYWIDIKNDYIKLALIALPYEMNPMGLKYHLALAEIGVTIIPASVRTFLCPPKKIIKLIQDLKPEFLIGRPLEVMRYAEGMNSAGNQSQDSSIRKIFLTGETMSDAKWNRIEELYGGAEIYSTYGLTELDTGLISCEKYKYHLPVSSNIIVEVLDEAGNMVKEGEAGEIVITNLEKNYAPLIRYKTGDIGKYFSNCSCSMDTPYLIILGRKNDMEIIGGVKVFPVQIEEVLFKNNKLGCEYQLIIESNSLRVNVEKQYLCNEKDEILARSIQDQIYSELNILAEVVIYEFNQLADKFGIARSKGCRFINITNMADEEKKKVLKINICNGDDLE